MQPHETNAFLHFIQYKNIYLEPYHQFWGVLKGNTSHFSVPHLNIFDHCLYNLFSLMTHSNHTRSSEISHKDTLCGCCPRTNRYRCTQILMSARPDLSLSFSLQHLNLSLSFPVLILLFINVFPQRVPSSAQLKYFNIFEKTYVIVHIGIIVEVF